MKLRRRLAEFGFESNDDYDFAVRCFLETTTSGLRCAELVGSVSRRKTAFANALAFALDYPHRLYHDFSKAPSESELVVKITDEHTGDSKTAKPLTAFERVLTEACAFSESARTILVLDQLQLCDFADQLRLFQFLTTTEWSAGIGASVKANARNLIVILISNEALYHSLQKISFRIWTDAGQGLVDFKAIDLGLPEHATRLLERFADVFLALNCAPTLGEYKRILLDCEQRVRTVEQLRTVLFGRMENLSRADLHQAQLNAPLAAVVEEITHLLGVEEVSL
jgi:hypothetical protein